MTRPFATRVLSDRRKVVATVLLLTTATLAAITFVTVRTTRDQLISRTDASLRSQLGTAQAATKLLSPAEQASLSAGSKVLDTNTLLIVTDNRGRVVWSASGLPTVSRPRTSVIASAERKQTLGHPFTVNGPNGSSYRAIAGLIGHGQTIVYAAPLAPVHATVHDLTVRVVVIGGIAALLLCLVLWGFLTAASRPIDAMIGVASEIGRGDLTARIDDNDLAGEARRLGVALNQMVTRLQQDAADKAESEELLRQFIADASHELRTPITNIRGYAQLSRMGAADDPAEAIEHIEAETTRMSELVDDLLLLARFDQGRVAPREPVDLVAIVKQVVADARVVEPGRLFRLGTAEESLVLGNADELRRVFANLLANVRVHAPGTEPCEITLETNALETIVTVTDHGPGMTPDVATKAFDRFYRADESRARDSGGSGLGLAISQAIVIAHGGTVRLTSTPGAGAVATVSLPRVLVARPSHHARASA